MRLAIILAGGVVLLSGFFMTHLLYIPVFSCSAQTTFIYREDDRDVVSSGSWLIFSHLNRAAGNFEGSLNYYSTQGENKYSNPVNVSFETEHIFFGRIIRILTTNAVGNFTNESLSDERIRYISPVLGIGQISYRTVNYIRGVGIVAGLSDHPRIACQLRSSYGQL